MNHSNHSPFYYSYIIIKHVLRHQPERVWTASSGDCSTEHSCFATVPPPCWIWRDVESTSPAEGGPWGLPPLVVLSQPLRTLGDTGLVLKEKHTSTRSGYSTSTRKHVQTPLIGLKNDSFHTKSIITYCHSAVYVMLVHRVFPLASMAYYLTFKEWNLFLYISLSIFRNNCWLTALI